MSQDHPFLFVAGGRGPLQPPPSYQPHASTQPPPPPTGQNQAPPVTAQQAQMAAFQQNAALPAVPLDVLKGVPPEHVMAIIQALQSGQLTLPPTGPPPTGTATAPATALPAVAPTAPKQSTGKRLQDVNMDKEDGELEEGEEPDTGPGREFLRPPPTGPRKASPNPRERQARAPAGRRASVQTSPKQNLAQTASQRLQNGKRGASPSSAVRKPATNGTTRSRHSIDSGAAARAFVLQMHNAGYTFEQLAQEIPNKKALTRMYQSLKLPLSTEAAPPLGNATTTRGPQPLQLESVASPTIALVAKETPSVTLSTPSASLSKRLPPPKPAGPPDRAAYLAKLAAAKNPRAKATAAPPQASMDGDGLSLVAPKQPPAQPPAPTQPAPAHQLPPSATPAAAYKPADQPALVPEIPHPAPPPTAHKPATQPTAGKSAIKTELIKQKLEALKAERAASSSAAQISSDGLKAANSSAKSITAAGNLGHLLDSPSSTPSNNIATTSAGPLIRPMGAANYPSHAKAAPMPPPVQPVRPIQPLPQTVPSTAPVQPSYSAAAHQTAYSPAPPTPGRSFSSLPGLFMASAPVPPTPSFQQPLPLPPANSLPKPTLPQSTFIPANTTAATAYALPSFAAQRTAPSMAFSPYASSPIASPGPLSSLARKRPVAADFDNDQTRSVPKKPFSFGQSRSNSESERLVIEVSDDDDDEDDEMDLDPTPVRASPNSTAHRLPPRPSGSLPGLAMRSNSANAPPGSGSTVDIAGKDKAIAEMKRKIAEREAQQAQIRGLKANGKIAASATTSGKSTPFLPPPIPLTIEVVAADFDSAVPQSVSVGIKSPPSAVAERTLSAAGIAREQERMRLQQRFDELKEQIAGREDAVISASPAPASKQVISGADSAQSSYSRELVATRAQASDEVTGSSAEAVQEAPWSASHDSTVIRAQDARGLPGRGIAAKDQQVGSQVAAMTDMSQENGMMERAYEEPLSGENTLPGMAANHVPEMARGGDVQPISNAANEDVDMDMESSEEEGEIDDDDDDDDDDEIEGPPANITGPASPAQVEAAVAANMNDSLQEQAPAVELDTSSASSTDSEDYELETAANANGVHEQARAGQLGTSSASSTDSEDHELEARDDNLSEEGEVEDVEEEGEYEPTPALGSPAVAGDDEEGEEGEDYEPTIGAVNIEADDASPESPPAHITHPDGTVQRVEIADDLAPELQPAPAEQTVNQDEHKTTAENQVGTRTHFRPYESVLAKFHDYRFHPDYLDNVADGYKSLTYSHNIDSHTPWCPHEAAGGQCNDRTCGNQHLRDMGVTDNDLLKALTADRTPTSTAEAKARWKAGLTAVFQELRSKGLNKDAKVIAARIVAFRREFVGGGGRVLDLGVE